MGGAGPGPATVQNGYGGYGEYGVYYGYAGYADYQGPQPGYQAAEGDDYSDPSKTPSSAHAVPQPSMNMVPNHAPHLAMPQQFPSYPPNHPYAFGGGVGYPQGYTRPPQHMHQHQHQHHPQPHFHPQHQQHLQQQPYGAYGYQEGYHGGKLNPAAQGFKYNRYQQQQQQQQQQLQQQQLQLQQQQLQHQQAHAHAQAQAQAQSAQGPPPQPVPAQQPPQPAPAAAPFAPSQNQPSEPLQHPIPNGHSHPEPPTRSTPTAATKANEAQSAKEQEPVPASAAVKQENENAKDQEASPDASSAIAAPRWNFVHPSSLPSSSSTGIATPNLEMNKHAHAQRIRLVRTRPGEESDGNSFAIEVKAGLPEEIVVDEQSPLQSPSQSQEKGEKGARRKKQTSKGVWKTGEKKRVELVFGEIVPEQEREKEDKAELVSEKPVVDGKKEEEMEKKERSTPARAPAPAPSPAPAKPRSWAALLKTPTPSSPSTPAAVPSSSASVSSTTEAGPSRPRPSTSASPSTPNFTANVNGLAQPQLSPQSQGAQQQQAKTFNYAAAAMSSVPSPHEELIKLLSEGVSSLRGTGATVGLSVKEKEALTVPRGLINTGNMCFANTVS